MKSQRNFMQQALVVEKKPVKDLFSHKTKLNIVLRFSFVVFIFIAYLLYIVSQHGIQQGFHVSVLSWSFFVLATPVADAGFLIDFPLRLVLNIKMIVSEAFIWGFAILLNIITFFVTPDIYETTILLKVFKSIIEQPFPYWLIFILSMLGTFISIKFGDELLDTYKHQDRLLHGKHKNKHKFIVMIFLFMVIFIVYNFLLKDFNFVF